MTRSRVLLGLVGVVALHAVLVPTARLPVGETVLLPGDPDGGVPQVSGAAGELSLAVDVRNGGLVPVRVDGAADDRIGPYEVRLGRGGPGGGVPEEEVFAPFVLWPGQQRLLVLVLVLVLVLHLTRAGDPAPPELRTFRIATDGRRPAPRPRGRAARGAARQRRPSGSGSEGSPRRREVQRRATATPPPPVTSPQTTAPTALVPAAYDDPRLIAPSRAPASAGLAQRFRRPPQID